MIGEAHSNSCANLTCLKILTKHLKVVLLHNLAGPMMDSKLYERILLFTFDTILSVLFGMCKDENGNEMVNHYVHLGNIGSGSYGKVVRNLVCVKLKFQIDV
jgi:hypothetical protein